MKGHLLRVGDRVCFERYTYLLGETDTPTRVERTLHPEDTGTVAEVCRNGAVVVVWDTGDVDEVTRRGGPRCYPEIGVRWLARRVSVRFAKQILRLAVEERLDGPNGLVVNPLAEKCEARWEAGA